jgi:pilus assembly protein CpaD
MTLSTKNVLTLVATSLSAATLVACASSAPTAVPASYLQGTVLDRNAIGVEKRTEFLEVEIDGEASQLSLKDRARIQNFVDAYQSVGHGPLILSMPATSGNQQLAVAAVAEARAIAFETGISYEEIAGNSHGTEADEPMIMAYQTYDAVAPDCKSLASYDMANASSNNEMPSLGCAVRTNLAAMIADPADLLGQRALTAGDAPRRDVILAKFRDGQSTGSQRSSDESGTVSDAVAE